MSERERTCVIVKPDGVCRKVVGEVIKRLESEGLKLLGLRMLSPGRTMVEDFYGVHRGKPFFEPLVRFMTSGPIIVSAWEGDGAVRRVRYLIGATDSRQAAEGTLRRLYGTDNRRNLVHASDSPENGEREIGFFFRPEELIDYDANCWIDK